MRKMLLALVVVMAPGLGAATTPEQIAEALSQLIVNTRAAVAENFTKPNKVAWLPDALYQRILALNGVLPAAVAGKAFHPINRSGIIVLKMVVASPRNENNQPDDTERELFARVKKTGAPAAISTSEAAYHARPIKAVEWCLRCHGDPKGAPDPLNSRYKKEGWKVGEIIGAATARVKR